MYICVFVYLLLLCLWKRTSKSLYEPQRTAPRSAPARGAASSLQFAFPQRHDSTAPPPRAEPGPVGAAGHRPHGPATARGGGSPALRDKKRHQRPPPPGTMRRRVRSRERRSAKTRRRSAPAAPPARGLPLPVRAAASGLSPLPYRSPRICPRRGGAESRQPRPCGGGQRLELQRQERCPGRPGLAAEPPAAAEPAG